MATKSKTQKVLEYLKKKKSITSWQAITMFRATRLSSIIHELRRKHIIVSEPMRTNESAFVKYVYKKQIAKQL